jgi:hypothetical protein
MFAPWTLSVYVLSILTVNSWLPMSDVLNDWTFQLEFLMQAVCVGIVGTLVFTDGSTNRTRWQGALLGAGAGMAAAIFSGLAGCMFLTRRGSEGESWYGLFQLPVIFYATLTGLVIGIFSSKLCSVDS